MTTHADILQTRLGDFKDIPPLPPGTYAVTCTGIPRIDRMGQKQTQGAEFSFKINTPGDDVDPAALDAAGGIPQDPMTYTFWLTPKAGIIVQRFLLDVLGIAPGDTLVESLQQVTGAQCLATVVNKTNQKTKRTFAQIDGFARLE